MSRAKKERVMVDAGMDETTEEAGLDQLAEESCAVEPAMSSESHSEEAASDEAAAEITDSDDGGDSAEAMQDEPADTETFVEEPPPPLTFATRKALFSEVLPFFKGIDGWLTVPEGELLFNYARDVADGCIVEVGSYRGRSTSAICAGVSVSKGAAAGTPVPVFAVDPHEAFVGVKGAKFGPGDRREFFRTMVASRLVKYVRLLNLTSPVLSPGWNMPVSMLFLDGDHRYQSTLADFEAWWPHLTDGAIVLFANAEDDGPRQVIAEFVKRRVLTNIKTVGKITAFKFSVREQAPRFYNKPQVKEVVVQKNLDMDTVAYNVYYGGSGRYMYQAIPKCACTTIKTILLELEGLHVDENEWRRHQKDNNMFPGADWMDEKELNQLFRGPTRTFKFVVVRDPYTRLVSAYKDKIRMETKLRAKHWLNIIRSAAEEQGVTLSVEPTFEEFVHVVSQQPVEQMDSHWRPQYFEGRFGIISYNYVGHVEMLHSDLPYILEQIDAPEYLQKKANEQHNVTGSQMAIWDTVSSEIRQKFMRTFEIDFDTLCYPYKTIRH
jgi:hypothetical protein